MITDMKNTIKEIVSGIEGVQDVYVDSPDMIPNLPAITIDHQGDQQRPLTMGTFLLTSIFHIRVYADMGTDQRAGRDTVERISSEAMARLRANPRRNGWILRATERAVDKAATSNSRQAWVHPMILQIQAQVK